MALSLSAACYSGLGDPDPWRPGVDDGDESGSADDEDDDEDDGVGKDDGDSANDEANGDADANTDADAESDDGANDGAGSDTGSAEAGTDDGVGSGSLDDGGGSTDDGADTAADDGGASEVPDNEYCSDYAAWDDGWSSLEQQILDIVNQRRSEGANCGSEGVFGPAGPVAMNPALRCAARKHSQQMVENDFFAHTTPWGEGPGDRIDGAGYNGFTWGENIAAGNSTASATMNQWMESDGHCANIMNPDFEDLGVGYYPGGGYGHYWTQAFGAGG